MKLVLGIIVGILILVGIGVGVWFGTTQSEEQVNIVQESEEVRVAFYKYANYLLYGEAKEQKIDDFNYTDTFTIDEEYGNVEYLENLLAYHSLFSESIFNDETDDFADIPLSDMNDRIEFLIEYATAVPIDKDEVYNLYMSNGEEAAMEYINGYYTDIDEVSNYLVALYETYDMNYAEAMVFSLARGDEVLNVSRPERAIESLVSGSVSSLKFQCKEANLTMESIGYEE